MNKTDRKPIVRSPAELLREGLLTDFMEYAKQSGKFSAVGLEERIQDAKALAYFRSEDGHFEGVGGLKRQTRQYVQGIFKKAASPIPADSIPYEIGWIRVTKIGHRFGFKIIRKLVEAAENEGVYLTTEVDNEAIKKFALELGFRQAGHTYPSSQGNSDLLLFVLAPRR